MCTDKADISTAKSTYSERLVKLLRKVNDMKFHPATIPTVAVILSSLVPNIAAAHKETKHSMMKSSPDAEKAPYDLQFIDTMIHHHQGAVDMAKLAINKAQNQMIKDMAKNIVKDQEAEIGKLSDMRKKSFGGKPETVNMEMPGMMESMKGMDMKGMDMKGMGGMGKLEKSSGPEFDLLYIDMMIPHHEGGIAMSEDALKQASDKDIKEMAKNIIEKQRKEIDELNKIKGDLKTEGKK